MTEIAAPFEMSMPAISRHLKVLEKAGLISRGREAQWRPCKLKAEPLKQAADWLDEVVSFVAAVKKQNSFARPTLPQVYEELKKTRPDLSLGQFHDGLRTLHQQRRILLGPHTQNLATIPDVRNALYLDREVKFYVDLP